MLLQTTKLKLLVVEERQNFEVHFYDDGNKILGNMGQNVQAADAFIASITSYAAHTNQTCPYVVIPDFAVLKKQLMETDATEQLSDETL